MSGSSGYDTVTYAAGQHAGGHGGSDGQQRRTRARAAGDVFRSIENLTGTAFDDILRGKPGAAICWRAALATMICVGLAGIDTIPAATVTMSLTAAPARTSSRAVLAPTPFISRHRQRPAIRSTDFSAEDIIALSGAGFGVLDLEDIQFVDRRSADGTGDTGLALTIRTRVG